MGYYMRALLTEWEERPLEDLLSFSRDQGHELRLANGNEHDPKWREAEVVGSGASSPIELEVALEEDELLQDELEEFLEELEEAEGRGRSKRKVADHLRRTKAIVAVRVLASDSEAGLEAAHMVLAYYAQRDGVMFQADGEGFYEGEKLVIRTD